MKKIRQFPVVWMFLVLFSQVDYGECACHLENYVSSCLLNILDEHIEATAVINHCHLPLDITFQIAYQYKNSTRHDWKYTFVTTNQNERVLIPGLLLPIAPHAPVFLYARVPEAEYNRHNSSFVAIEASFIAELDTDKWEEADFLNHTVYIPSTNDCRFTRLSYDSVPWIVGAVFVIMLVAGAFGAGCYFYRKKKMAVDQMALVSAMEVGIPGSQPYQMDAVVEQNGGNNERQNQEALSTNDNSENTHSDSQNSENPTNAENTDEEDGRNGRKGFKFGRLQEDTSTSPTSSTMDASVVIGNPAFQDSSRNHPKRRESSEHPRRTSSPYVEQAYQEISKQYQHGRNRKRESLEHQKKGNSLFDNQNQHQKKGNSFFDDQIQHQKKGNPLFDEQSETQNGVYQNGDQTQNVKSKRKESKKSSSLFDDRNQNYVIENGMVNDSFQDEEEEGGEPKQRTLPRRDFVNQEMVENREVLDDEQYADFDKSENVNGTGQAGEGARRKVKGLPNPLATPPSSSKTIMASEAIIMDESQKGL